MSAPIALALSQVGRIVQLADFLDHPALSAAVAANVPVSMPQSIGSLGCDVPLTVGLGIVGAWAALDAYAERAAISRAKCSICGRSGCLFSRLSSTGKLSVPDAVALQELEDLRHLYAHNFAAQADSLYFSMSRHTLSAGKSARLSSGAVFDGGTVPLAVAHLRYYALAAQRVLDAIK